MFDSGFATTRLLVPNGLDSMSGFLAAYHQCGAWLPPVDVASLSDYSDFLSNEDICFLLSLDPKKTLTKAQGPRAALTLLTQAKILYHYSSSYRTKAETAQAQLELQSREAAMLRQKNSEVTLSNDFSQEKAWDAELHTQELLEEMESLKASNSSLRREIHIVTHKLNQATETIEQLQNREENLSTQLDQALLAYKRDTNVLRKTILSLREEIFHQSPSQSPEYEPNHHLTSISSTDAFGKSMKRAQESSKVESIDSQLTSQLADFSWMGNNLRDISLQLPETGLRNLIISSTSSHTVRDHPVHFTRKPCRQTSTHSLKTPQVHPVAPPKQVIRGERRGLGSSTSSEALAYQRPLLSRSRVASDNSCETQIMLGDGDMHGLAQRILTISDRILMEKIELPSIETDSSFFDFDINSIQDEPQVEPQDDESFILKRPAPETLSPNDSPRIQDTPQINKHHKADESVDSPPCDTAAALQRAMEGEFVYKSSRTLLGQEKRNLRYMWINPQSRSIYWCDVDPGTQRSLYMDRTHHRNGARSAVIRGIRLIADPWSPSETPGACFAQGISPLNMEAGISLSSLGETTDGGKRSKWVPHHNQLPTLSVIIQVPGKDIKIKARNVASHKAWESALLHLQSDSVIIPNPTILPLLSPKPTSDNHFNNRRRRSRIQYIHSSSVTPTLNFQQ